ncbi:MAG: DUF4091 domain-containing protein [Bryobacterales bacterium]|nr:DUF4091 domain-containing protein [Bryobacterales bacterium]
MPYRIVSLSAFLFWLLSTCICRAGVGIWAVSDGVRVEPVSGRVLESRPDIHKDYPVTGFRRGNLAWDPATRTIRLKAARNEFVAAQAIIETTTPLDGVNVHLNALRNHNGLEIGGKHIALLKEWYIPVRRASTGYEASSLGPAWYPDALLPFRRDSLAPGVPFSIPDLYNNIPRQTNQAIWIDVYIPAERHAAPPGEYSGELTVTWKSGQTSVRVAVNVWDFALPEESHLPGDIWNGSMKQMPPEEELAYYQMARRHRFVPLVYAYRPKLTLDGGKALLDWTEFDSRLTRYLDGSAFTEKYGYWGPGYGLPLDHMMLPFNVEKHGRKGTAWPAALPAQGRTAAYEALWTGVARQVRAHLDANPLWHKVRKIAFLDGLDESYSEEAYEKMVYYGKLLHDAMGRDWFSYRIDGGYTPEAMEKLSREVQLWVCHTVSFDPGLVPRLRKAGVETWFYGPMIYEQKKNSGCGSNTFTDLDLLVNRGIGWVGWKYQAGWVEWEFDWNAYAAWYEPENFKDNHRVYNGSGQLIYRGAVMGYREPIASVRLKAQRRGLQDYEYFWLLAEKRGKREEANAAVNRIVYKRPFGVTAMRDIEVWRNDPDEWDRTRIELGELLNAR